MMEVSTMISRLNVTDNEHRKTSYDFPIHKAARENILHQVEDLLNKKVSVNLKNKFGDTALHLAAEKNYIPLARLLINRGANLDERNIGGWTALHYSTRQNHLEMVDILLQSGAYVDVEDSVGYTPLFDTITNFNSNSKSLEIAKLLIKNKANLNWRLEICFMSTYLHCCARCVCDNNYEIAKLIIDKGVDINIQNTLGLSPLHVACRRENFAMVKLFLERGAHVDAQDLLLETPLSEAIVNSLNIEINLSVIDYLLKNGANVNLKNDRGFTCLHHCVGRGDFGIKVAKLLIKQCINVDARNDGGETTLHRLFMYNNDDNSKLLDILLEAGCDLNLQDNNGDTPLHLAVLGGHTWAIEKLLDRGSEIGIGNVKGVFPYHNCSKMPNEMKDIFFKHFVKLKQKGIQSLNEILGIRLPMLAIIHIVEYLNNEEMEYLTK